MLLLSAAACTDSYESTPVDMFTECAPGLPRGDTISDYIIQGSARFGKSTVQENTLSNAEICPKKNTEAVQESPAPLRHQKKRGVWMKNLGFCSQARVPAPFLRTLIVYPPFVLKS